MSVRSKMPGLLRGSRHVSRLPSRHKGFEVSTDTYVLLEPEEIEATKLESKHTIDLVQFVEAKDIDYRFFERPYLLVPTSIEAGGGKSKSTRSAGKRAEEASTKKRSEKAG